MKGSDGMDMKLMLSWLVLTGVMLTPMARAEQSMQVPQQKINRSVPNLIGDSASGMYVNCPDATYYGIAMRRFASNNGTCTPIIGEAEYQARTIFDTINSNQAVGSNYLFLMVSPRFGVPSVCTNTGTTFDAKFALILDSSGTFSSFSSTCYTMTCSPPTAGGTDGKLTITGTNVFTTGLC